MTLSVGISLVAAVAWLTGTANSALQNMVRTECSSMDYMK